MPTFSLSLPLCTFSLAPFSLPISHTSFFFSHLLLPVISLTSLSLLSLFTLSPYFLHSISQLSPSLFPYSLPLFSLLTHQHLPYSLPSPPPTLNSLSLLSHLNSPHTIFLLSHLMLPTLSPHHSPHFLWSLSQHTLPSLFQLSPLTFPNSPLTLPTLSPHSPFSLPTFFPHSHTSCFPSLSPHSS